MQAGKSYGVTRMRPGKTGWSSGCRVRQNARRASGSGKEALRGGRGRPISRGGHARRSCACRPCSRRPCSRRPCSRRPCFCRPCFCRLCAPPSWLRPARHHECARDKDAWRDKNGEGTLAKAGYGPAREPGGNIAISRFREWANLDAHRAVCGSLPVLPPVLPVVCRVGVLAHAVRARLRLSGGVLWKTRPVPGGKRHAASRGRHAPSAGRRLQRLRPSPVFLASAERAAA